MKDSLFLEVCEKNYSAIFQMLRRAVELCPAELWDQRTNEPPFWQQAYHTYSIHHAQHHAGSPNSIRVRKVETAAE